MIVQKQGLFVVFTGAPGCGKGTQAQILQKKTGIPHISTGAILRQYVQTETAKGQKLREKLAKGELVSDDIVCSLLKERINQSDCRNGFILDGFPRTLSQAETLMRILSEKGIKLNCALEIQVPDEIIEERILGRYTCMQCGAGYHDKFQQTKVYGVCDNCGGVEFSRRQDDNREIVRQRLLNYRLQTYPTIPFFASKGLLKTVDGTGTIQAVSNRIAEVLHI